MGKEAGQLFCVTHRTPSTNTAPRLERFRGGKAQPRRAFLSRSRATRLRSWLGCSRCRRCPLVGFAKGGEGQEVAAAGRGRAPGRREARRGARAAATATSSRQRRRGRSLEWMRSGSTWSSLTRRIPPGSLLAVAGIIQITFPGSQFAETTEAAVLGS